MKKAFFIVIPVCILIVGAISLYNFLSDRQKAEPEAYSSVPELNVFFLTFEDNIEDVRMIEDAVNSIIVPEIGVRIKLRFLNFGIAQQQYNLMLTSGEKLDLFLTFPFTYDNLVANGYLRDLGPLLDLYGQGIKDVLGKYLSGCMINGKIFGVRPISDLASGTSLIIRKDIVEKYDIDLSGIRSYPDIEKILAAIKAAEPESTPLVPSNVKLPMLEMLANFTMDILGDSYGVLPDFGKGRKIENWYASDEYRNLLEIQRDWYLKGYILPDAATNMTDQFSLLRNGIGYCYLTPSKPGLRQQESSQIGLEIIDIELTKPFASTNAIQIFQWVVPVTSSYPEEAVKLLNLMYTNEDVINLLAWGIEGVHYRTVGDGVINFPEGVDGETSGYYIQSPWLVGNEFLGYIWEGNDPQLWEKTKAWNENALLSDAMGFSFDQRPVKNEVAVLDNVVTRYRKALESGAVNPDKILPIFLDKLESAGIEKVIAEKQRQFDAWLSEKK